MVTSVRLKAHVHKTGLTVRACGLVVNLTFPWLGASPDWFIA